MRARPLRDSTANEPSRAHRPPVDTGRSARDNLEVSRRTPSAGEAADVQTDHHGGTTAVNPLCAFDGCFRI